VSVTSTGGQQAPAGQEPVQPARKRQSAGARVLVLLVTGYRRFVSPVLPPSCRFYPSCSAYALEAVQVHGALRGSWLAVRRLSRCHPFHAGGLDPVPPARSATGQAGGRVNGTGPEFSEKSARELAGG
jgi:putative membrane protein insertion efficiency factor